MRHQGSFIERFRKMNRGQKAAAGLACIMLITALCFYFAGRSGEEKQRGAGQKPLVKVMQLQRADMNRHIVLSGQTVAVADVVLAPKYTGRVAEVRVKLGDRVEAGDVLMVQDTADLDISIAQKEAEAGAARANALEAAAIYEANYLRARNDYELERDKYERNQYLYSIGAISQDTLDSVQQEFLASQAAFEILENQVENGRPASVQAKSFAAEQASLGADALVQQREDLLLRAPRAGIISYRNVEVGELVSAGTKVLTLVDNSHANVDCYLSEADAAILVPGTEIKVTIDALGRDYVGRIVYVSPSMEENSKAYLVRIELLVKEGDMVKAGLFAHTALDVLQRRQTLYVPKTAVTSRTGKQTVWVLREDGTAEEREVRIGLFNDEMEEILSGLAEGDIVILSNQDRLQNGMAVEAVYTEAAQ